VLLGSFGLSFLPFFSVPSSAIFIYTLSNLYYLHESIVKQMNSDKIKALLLIPDRIAEESTMDPMDIAAIHALLEEDAIEARNTREEEAESEAEADTAAVSESEDEVINA